MTIEFTKNILEFRNHPVWRLEDVGGDARMDASWLRERAEAIAATGGPDANAAAGALLEAADALDSSAASAEAAP